MLLKDNTDAVEPGAPSMGAKSLCIPLDQPAPITSSDKCIHPDCKRKPLFYTLKMFPQGPFYLALVAATVVSAQLNYQNPQFGNRGEDECCQEYCYSTDVEPYIQFATKTAYESLNRKTTGAQHIVPEKIYSEVVANYEQRSSYPNRGRFCIEDYNLLKRWRWNDTITEDKGHSLTQQGIEELKILARRYKTKFSQLLSGGYDERSFFFQYTSADKTHDSYQAYIEGLFGSDAFRVHANTQIDERLMKPYEECEAWQKNEANNQFSRSEYERFKESPEYQQLVRDVFRRLGFRYALNASIIEDIYDMYLNRQSPWCVAFNKDQLKLLEYAEDLKYYYETGYGNRISEMVGCGPVKDFYDRFERTVNGNGDGVRATYFFSNSATMQTVLTALGIAKDYNPLKADNYHTQTSRNWKTSLIDPFASNLVSVLYQCRGPEKFKVMFFLNENPVDFPECSVGLCNWSTVQQKYQDLASTCNVEEFCSERSSSAKVIASIFLLIASIMFLTW
nr:unnamed protein product [Callosobruchus analis]